ncbi:hypothetical protein JOC69_002998 [Heliobacterium gestii]|nr:hypothetical protein [Heliomicrobium gestii]
MSLAIAAGKTEPQMTPSQETCLFKITDRTYGG